MRIMMITQKIDPADPMLGFTLRWVQALAEHVDQVDVVCLEHPPTNAPYLATLPANVHTWSMGKERGFGRVRIMLAYLGVLLRLIRRVDVIFTHMVPRYVWLAAPLAFLFRKPQVLWYTHRHVGIELRLALFAARSIVTADQTSFPIKSRKVRVLGHGIDDAFFAPDPSIARDDPPLIVHVARLMPIKHQATLIEALTAFKQVPLRAALVGTGDPRYTDELKALARSRGVADKVVFTGGMTQAQVLNMYQRATIAVNLSPVGLFDKAALESMLVGVPTITSNPAFDAVYGGHAPLLLISGPDDIHGLTARISEWLSMDAGRRKSVTVSVRERALASHSLNGLMAQLKAIFEA